MKFMAAADTDIGIYRADNQDSLLIKHAKYNNQEVLMAIVCDGMGGSSKAELASATVIKSFSAWFDNQLEIELENFDIDIIGYKWSLLLKDLNAKIKRFGIENNLSLGTTFTGILLFDDKYLIVHIGDSRAYYLGTEIIQLTVDQTYVQREITRGTMTVEEAKTDKRKNVLLQCVGASETIEPQVITGNIQEGVYLLCSDGFTHEISSKEIFEGLNIKNLKDKNVMHENSRKLIETVKNRKEKDNISVIVIKVGGI